MFNFNFCSCYFNCSYKLQCKQSSNHADQHAICSVCILRQTEITRVTGTSCTPDRRRGGFCSCFFLSCQDNKPIVYSNNTICKCLTKIHTIQQNLNIKQCFLSKSTSFEFSQLFIAFISDPSLTYLYDQRFLCISHASVVKQDQYQLRYGRFSAPAL